ncbi:MAG: ATP-binding cassette domain-containing protein, partial [Acidimicrobiales bacterium]
MDEITSSEVAARLMDSELSRLDPDANRPSNVITTSGLNLNFGAKSILTGVNMEFTRGTITALIGPTGSGKSTFLRTINRMNDKVPSFKHEGDVKLDGESIWSSNQDLLTLRRRVGMLFQ